MSSTNSEQYLYRLSQCSKTDVDKLSLAEYLYRNRYKTRVVRKYYKMICGASFWEVILFLVLYTPVLFFVPAVTWFNPIGANVDPVLNSKIGLVLGIISWLFVDILFRVYFKNIVKARGLMDVCDEIYWVILEDTRGVKFQRYYLMRFRPSFLRLEFNNLVDWFVAKDKYDTGIED